MLNDHLAGIVKQHPKRFLGLGTVPLQAPKLAVEELTRCVVVRVKERGGGGGDVCVCVCGWDV